MIVLGLGIANDVGVGVEFVVVDAEMDVGASVGVDDAVGVNVGTTVEQSERQTRAC